MTSITAQQTKIDLELVPKENRLDIGKCNGRIPRGLKPKEETFQVVLDALALTPCYPAFIITADVPEVYMNQFWNCVYKHENFYRFKIDKKKNIKTYFGSLRSILRFAQRHRESKAYRELSGHAIGVVPPKIARKFKKASPTKKDSDLVPVDVAHGKGIELLSEVALTEKAQLKEVRKKSLRDFHKTHPSGFGTGAEKPLSVEKITPTITSEGTGDKLGVPGVTEDDSTESESESWGNDKDDGNNEQEASDEGSGQENESKNQEYDSEQDEEFDNDNQEEEEVDQENEYEDDEIESDEDKGMDDTTDQFDDVSNKGNGKLVDTTRTSYIPHTDAEIVSPFDVPVQHEVPNTQTTTLLPIHVYVITTIPQSLQTFTPPPLVSTPTPPPTTEATNPPTTLSDFASVFRFNYRITTLEKEVAEIKKDPLHTQESLMEESIAEKDQMPQLLTQGNVLNFAPPVIKKLIKESRDEVTLAKVSSQPQSTYEAASILTEFELKKILLDKMEINFPVTEHLMARSGTDLKMAKLGVITTSTTNSKAAKYDLPDIEDMVPNIWSPVKVAYDRYALWGISHWREQRKSFYAYARGIQSRGDVYSTKRILAVTHVKVMRKHGYEYLEEIVVRRADNVLYRFKEGDFLRLRINDIEDMLILMVQNRLINLSGDDVADFAIALRMFTKSLVIQKRVEDLQLGVESYQKKINITKPNTTRPDLRKRRPYTPYKDPQGFIYVDDHKRNILMQLPTIYYKFIDGYVNPGSFLARRHTKNIDMEYLTKRRWSILEKKRAYFMTKDINKLLKERRMIRYLEKLVGDRLYGIDLRLLQRTI
ncbi:hypothetical protein Tco_0265940 [Tanacetum coccineum]